MRVARVLLFLALSGAVAHADDAKPADPHPAEAAPARAKVPLRVVRMLPETKQALLFDRTKGTHVVVEAGQTIEGFYVDSLDDDEVMLLSENGATVVLAAPDPSWRHRRDGDGDSAKPERPAKPVASTAKPGEPQPADPYADLAASPEIGTGADGVRVVEAPDAPAMAPTSAPVSSPVIGTGADGVRVVEAPPVSVPATAPVSVPAAAPAPAPPPVTAAATTATPHDPAGEALAAALTGAPAPSKAAPAAPAADGPIVLARADVNTALASFGTLAGSIRGAFTPTGVRVDSVAPGSLFAKAGLKAGDLVSAVDGVPLTSLDAAADLYARAGKAKSVNVAVQRAGTPIVLRLAIQ